MYDLNELQRIIRERITGTRAVAAVLDGSLTRAQYAAYLSDVWHYAQHSSTVIGIAASRTVQSHPALSDYLFHHAREEIGHDLWAFDDLKDLGLADTEIRSSRPSLACASMVAVEYYWAAHGNPVGLFGWLYWLEAMGGDMGGAMAAGVERSLKLEGKALRFVAGHGVADEHHSEDLASQITKNVSARSDLDDVFYVARHAGELYAGILDTAMGAAAP